MPGSFTPASHSHGIITNSGYAGTASNKALYTGTNGVITASTLPISAGGTGATKAEDVRANLGLGSMATETATNYIPKSTLSGAYDIMYSSSANSPTRLAANTTSTKKFLRMKGTGTTGAAPAWDTVTKTDVGLDKVENTALSTWAGSSNITTLGTITTGTVPWARLSNIPAASTTTSGIIKIGTGSSDAAAGNHTHSAYSSSTHTHATTMTTTTATSDITLTSGSSYKLGTGGTSIVFTMPTVSEYGHPGYDAVTASAYKIGRDATGHVIVGDALTYGDVGAAASQHSHGNITYSGQLGTASRIVVTDSQKNITVGSIDPANLVVTTDTRLSDARTPKSHSHGDISNVGTVSSTAVTPASGDYILITDSNATNNHAVKRGIAIGTSTTSFLTNKGTWATPPNDNDNTTYTFTTGTSSGQIKVTPSTGSAYDVSVNGLGSAAYTASSAYSSSTHTHTTTIAADTGTAAITLAHGSKYKLTTGGTSVIFQMPSDNNSDTLQNVALATTSKAYITAVTTAPTATASAMTAVGDTGVYLTTTAGQLNATTYKVNEQVTLQ